MAGPSIAPSSKKSNRSGLIARTLRKLYRRVFLAPSRRHFRYSELYSGLRAAVAYHPQEEMLRCAMEFLTVSCVTGDYLEFGVYEGWSFVAAYHLSNLYGFDSMRFYAFDSFRGLPETKGLDRQDFFPFGRGDCACDAKTFQANLVRQGVDLSRVTLVPGWYQDTLIPETRAELPIQKAALIWIDSDLYESAALALRFTTDYVQDGTVIVFDDWFAFRGRPDLGEQRAFHEWLASTPSVRAVDFTGVGWHGKSFILHLAETALE